MMSVMQEIEKMFQAEDWVYEHSEKYPDEFFTRFTGDNAKWSCRGFIEGEIFVFLVMFPSYVPKDKQSVVAELICRLNNLFYLGCFQFDPDSGGVMFRTSGLVTAEESFSTMVQELIRSGVVHADDCYPAVMKVIYGTTTPEQAVEEIIKLDQSAGTELN